MSFILKHHRLFDVSVEEEGSGDVLSGFAFRPSSDARRRFNDHQLIFRGGEGGFAVYYRTNPLAADPLLGPINQRVRFSVYFVQDQGDFFETYEPDLTPATGPQLYLDNLTDAGGIQPVAKTTLSGGDTVASADAMKVYPRVFSTPVGVGGGAPPTKFVVRDKFDSNTVVLEVPIEAGSGAQQTVTKIDMSSQPAGPYTLETDAAGAVQKNIYVDDGLAAARVLGVVDVHWETLQSASPPGGLSYVIRFRKR